VRTATTLHAILAVMAVLSGIAGCESRECERVPNIKGEEVCREDAEQQAHLDPAEPDANWRNGREPRTQE
jgi:hypothetical protein